MRTWIHSGTWFVLGIACVLAACGGGGGGATSAPAPAPPAPTADTARPTITLTAPGNGAVVTGIASLQASATDDTGVIGVQFRIDGVDAGAEDRSLPYAIDYDTTALANGTHMLTAVARDAAGNSATATGITVTVSNAAPPAAGQVSKPAGIFSSSGAGNSAIYRNPQVRGALIRASWSDIEPSPGVYDFSRIAAEVATVKANGNHWSLAIHGGGPGSPAWLIDQLGAPYISYTFRGEPGFRLPLFWDAQVQQRIRQMAERVAQEYGSDPALQLVYVTQMTANGTEGHLQGVDMATFKAAGYTDDRWVEAGKQAARSFAEAFTDKAIAFEVHDVDGAAVVPSRIINDLWNDPALGHRVGAGMWWISGKTSYQPDLIDVLKAYPGDIYGQVIGRSDESERFQDGDYTTVFTQAMEIGLRYIEPWEYEVKTGPGTADGAWDATFAQFNAYADALDAADMSP
jgi:hypothetical protein